MDLGEWPSLFVCEKLFRMVSMFIHSYIHQVLRDCQSCQVARVSLAALIQRLLHPLTRLRHCLCAACHYAQNYTPQQKKMALRQ